MISFDSTCLKRLAEVPQNLEDCAWMCLVHGEILYKPRRVSGDIPLPGHPGRQTTRARWESQWFQFDDQTSSTGSESLVPYLVVCLGSLLWNHPEPLKDRERLLSGSGERLVRRQGNVLKPKDQLYLYGSCPTSSVLRPPKTHLKQPS